MRPPDPPLPGPDEVLIEVGASGVANWNDLVRAGSWDVGRPAPLALGTQCAGVVAAVGSTVDSLAVGDRVMTHSVPLRDQGAWAPGRAVDDGLFQHVDCMSAPRPRRPVACGVGQSFVATAR
jgi:NADPH:quinone reductase-like Zn-dependent oxidoreductase